MQVTLSWFTIEYPTCHLYFTWHAYSPKGLAYGYILNKYKQICPGLNTNEIQIPYDKHHKVSSFVKSHQNTHNRPLSRNAETKDFARLTSHPVRG